MYVIPSLQYATCAYSLSVSGIVIFSVRCFRFFCFFFFLLVVINLLYFVNRIVSYRIVITSALSLHRYNSKEGRKIEKREMRMKN